MKTQLFFFLALAICLLACKNSDNQTNIDSKESNSVFVANSIAIFNVGNNSYFAINDNVDGFNQNTDAIVNITNFIGNLTLNNFI